MTLPPLDDAQEDALRAVARLFLSETRWISGASPDFPERMRDEILKRRAVCTLITEGG